jgi:hypothetical protein
MNTKFIYDFILPFFIGDDKYRKWQGCVHGDPNGFLYATEGHLLIRVPKEKAAGEYPSVNDFPNAEKILTEAINRDGNKTSVIKTADLIRVLSGVAWERVVDYDECEKCKGKGSFTCEHCENDYDCKDCNGTGRERYGEVREFSLPVTKEQYAIQIGKAIYKATYLQPIVIAAQMLGVEEMKYIHRNKESAGIFSFAGVDILLMPILLDSTDYVLQTK